MVIHPIWVNEYIDVWIIEIIHNLHLSEKGIHIRYY